jgi:hypothetical protein
LGGWVVEAEWRDEGVWVRGVLSGSYSCGRE